EGGIELTEQVLGMSRANADDNAVRFHEVINCRTFLEELWIACGVDIYFCFGTKQVIKFLIGADGNSAFDDDNLPFSQQRSQSFPHTVDTTQIGSTGVVLVWRRTNTDEDKLCPADSLSEICRELQSPLLAIILNQFFQAWLIDRQFAREKG